MGILDRLTSQSWTSWRIAVAALIVIGLYFAFQLVIALSHLWAMVFAAVIVAVLIRSVADPIMRLTRLPTGVAVPVSVVLILTVLGGSIYLFGSEISAQVVDLLQRVPLGLSRIEAAVDANPLGLQLTDGISQITGYAERAFAWAQEFAMSLAGALTGLLLVFVAGIYMALSPGTGREGLICLLPLDRRARARDVLNTVGRSLKAWLMAQLLAMVTVGLLCGIGLWLIGVPSPVALGVLTALLDFVPIVGPIAATIPAVLMAATVGWQEALLTLGLYFVVQQVESILIMPLAQKSVAKLPVILTIFSVIAFGSLFGPLGVLLSAPAALTLYVLITMLYRQDVLKDPDAKAPGET